MVRLNPGDIVLRMNGEDFGSSTGWRADVVADGMLDVLCPDAGRPKPTHDSWYSRCLGQWNGKLSFALFEAYKMLSQEERKRLFVEFETFVVNIESLTVVRNADDAWEKSFLVGDFDWGSFVDASIGVDGRHSRMVVDKVPHEMRWDLCAERTLGHVGLAKAMEELLEPTW